jgi:hypothetical protein
MDDFHFRIINGNLQKKGYYSKAWRYICTEKECFSISKGINRRCITHGGGFKCVHMGCYKLTRRPKSNCIKHSEFKSCKISDCKESAIYYNELCKIHHLKNKNIRLKRRLKQRLKQNNNFLNKITLSKKEIINNITCTENIYFNKCEGYNCIFYNIKDRKIGKYNTYEDKYLCDLCFI